MSGTGWSPPYSLDARSPRSDCSLADLIASGDRASLLSAVARTIAAEPLGKSSLAQRLRISRSLASSAVASLLTAGEIISLGTAETGQKGRPAELFSLSPDAGLLLIADLGARHAHIAAVDLQQNLLSIEDYAIDIRVGPEPTVSWLIEHLRATLSGISPARPLSAIVVGLPTRLDRRTSVPVRPETIPSWDGFPVIARLREAFRCPIVLENDVNLIAQGEAVALDSDELPLVAVKVGTAISAGLVDDHGRLVHGHDGSAGEIGHIPLRSAPAIRCSCGNEGCLDAVASLPAMASRYAAAHPDHHWETAEPAEHFLAMVRDGDPDALAIVREAAENVGEAIALQCNTLNPRRVTISGEFVESTDEFLAGVRSVVYRLARPLATRNLIIEVATFGNTHSAIAGATALGLRAVLTPDRYRTAPRRGRS